MLHQNGQGIPLWLTESRLWMGRVRCQRQGWHPTQQLYEGESPRHVQRTQGADSVQQTKQPPEPVVLQGGRAKYGAGTSET